MPKIKNISAQERLHSIPSSLLHEDIRQKDPSLVSDYAKVVLPSYREEAAKTIQSAFRVSKKRSTIIYKGKTLYEPDDDGFQEDTVTKIKAQRYDEIDYQHSDFIRRLFGILRANKITMNEMMTAQLMYEMLLCFNHNQMPENPQQQFQRYTLSHNVQGPYQPTFIKYWTNAETEQLNDTLEQAESNEKLHYYTMNLKQQHVAAFFYDLMKFSRGKIKKHTNQMLQDYVETKADSKEKRLILTKLQELVSNKHDNATIDVFAQQVRQFILDHESSFSNWISNYKHNTERSSIRFLAAISHTETEIPALCRSPQYDINNPNTPILSFVLPTIDTLNLLQRLIHGEESVIPAGVVGRFSTRLIRAYLKECPSAKISSQSTTREIIATLYPTADMFDAEARPVELFHPDMNKTESPHGYLCYDFLLSWHDLFHAWRSGSNFKALIKKLIQIHDEKAGFVEGKSGMSKNIWSLVDMDFSTGKLVRKASANYKTYYQLLNIFHILKEGGFDFSKSSDDNVLLIYHLFQSPTEFKKLFFNHDLAEIIDFISDKDVITSFPHDLQPSLSKFLSKFFDTLNYLQDHPKATIMELLLKDILQPAQEGDDALLCRLNQLDCKKIFYWSKNTGVYFKKEFQKELEALNVKRQLRNNDPNLIRQALNKIIANYNPALQQSSKNFCQPKSTPQHKADFQKLFQAILLECFNQGNQQTLDLIADYLKTASASDKKELLKIINLLVTTRLNIKRPYEENTENSFKTNQNRFFYYPTDPKNTMLYIKPTLPFKSW